MYNSNIYLNMTGLQRNQMEFDSVGWSRYAYKHDFFFGMSYPDNSTELNTSGIGSQKQVTSFPCKKIDIQRKTVVSIPSSPLRSQFVFLRPTLSTRVWSEEVPLIWW